MAAIGKKIPRVGVVFSSGFFGFFAHAGVLAAIREQGIQPCGYSGASSGAIVAAMAASGMGDSAIRKMLFQIKKKDFWDPDPWHWILARAFRLFRGYTGYLKGRGFAGLLQRLPHARIEECKTPLVIAATNLTDKKATMFTRGDLIRTLQASGAVPVLFKPVRIQGKSYVDGGLTSKAPLRALTESVELDLVIVHLVSSHNLVEPEDSFLRKAFTPWHIQHLATNIARWETYRRELEWVRSCGIRVFEVKTNPSNVGPNHLKEGPSVYETARRRARTELSGSLLG